MKIPDFWYRDGFLGGTQRERFERLLDSGDFSWESSQKLGFAGRGDVRQLAGKADRESPRASVMQQTIASLIYDELAPLGLPAPEELTANAFPVRMAGAPRRPAVQLPHRDSSASGRRPVVTAIYYVAARQVAGGELLVLPPAAEAAEHPDWKALRDTARIIVPPREDALAVIGGDVVHAVAPLTGGTRISIVCNFFQG